MNYHVIWIQKGTCLHRREDTSGVKMINKMQVVERNRILEKVVHSGDQRSLEEDEMIVKKDDWNKMEEELKKLKKGSGENGCFGKEG